MSHNDSSLSCRSCAFGRRSDALCDIHGTAITNTLVCRSYRAPGQNHMEARAEHPLLENLHPGLVYTIKANKVGDGQALSASFKIEPILRKEPVPKLGDTLVESYNIQVRNIDGSESPGRFDCYENGLVILAMKDIRYGSESAGDVFHALLEIRQQMEIDGRD
ncbi:MAG: hypothetical protein IPP03_00395 [Dechloromonas sp.]|nr:hypothetical protein [Candidatus Dechloromonas phosphoritropha]MBP8789550.1 hypothetical protein [Azonexus sp.]MBP9229780.1 hypothetical protein [Azonexus sp.]